MRFQLTSATSANTFTACFLKLADDINMDHASTRSHVSASCFTHRRNSGEARTRSCSFRNGRGLSGCLHIFLGTVADPWKHSCLGRAQLLQLPIRQELGDGKACLQSFSESVLVAILLLDEETQKNGKVRMAKICFSTCDGPPLQASRS